MNKHGWTYKKLGEVCEVERGGSPRPIQQYITDSEDGINWIKIGDAQEGSKYITSTKEKIIPEGVKKSRLVHCGDFILSNSMSFGRPYILKVDGCIHDGWLVIRDEHETFMKDYLYYYLSSPTLYRIFTSLAVGGVVNNLNSKLVRNVDVLIPPKEEQEAIVAELDEINETIELLKQQVADLDALAQSAFNTMFGDPISNEKGWEIKKLGSLCTIERGGSPRPIKDFITEAEDGINWIKIGDAKDGSIFIDSTAEKIKPEGMKKSRLVHKGDFILSNSMSFGRPYILRVDGCIHDGWLVIRDDNHIFDKYFLFYFLSSQNVYNEFKRLAVGGVVNNLNSSMVRALNVFVPPITTQQEFANKVEAIESVKVELNAQIAEMQNLLASRMDYYFD